MITNLRKDFRHQDGVLIAWKDDQFELLDQLDINYDDVFKRYKIRGAAMFKKEKPGIIALMKDKKSQKKFILTNSHFEHNPNVDFVKFASAFWMMK
jgi:hypothetical protein